MEWKCIRISGLMLMFYAALIFPSNALDTLGADYKVYPSSLKPGIEGYVVITLTNPGNSPIEDVYVFKIKAESPITIDDYMRNIGDIAPGLLKTLIVKFKVPENTGSGYYLLDVNLGMRVAGSSEKYVFQIPLKVERDSVIGLSVLPEKIEADKPANLTLRVQNEGSIIKNLRISWKGEGIIPLSESSSMFIGSMDSGEAREFILRVKALKQGTAILHFNITYEDIAGSTVHESRSVALEVMAKKKGFLDVTLTPSVLEIGKKGELAFNLMSKGEEMWNVLITWKSEAIMPSSSSSKFIDVLEAGEQKTVSFDVYVNENVEPGYYPVDVVVEYDLSDSNVKSEETFSVMIVGDIALTATLFRAESDKVFISVANTGNAPARNIVVYASSEYGKGEVFIGDMKPGDEEIIEIDQRNVDTSKPYSITLKIEYRDVFGENNSEIKEVNVHHFSEGVSSAYILGGTVLLAAIIAGIWILRRK